MRACRTMASAARSPSVIECAGWLLALGAGLLPTAVAAAEMTVPTCAQFIEYGQKWVGLDEAFAAQVLGLPLYALSDADVAHIETTLRECASAAGSADERALLEEDLRHVALLRAARERVRRALADFDSAKKKAQPRLEQLAAKLDDLPALPSSRAAVDDAQATVSAIFFELEQKRLRAQVKEPLAEDYPAYSRVVAALARMRRAYAAQAQRQLITEAEDALERHRPEVERLGLPAEAQDATIILKSVDAGGDVRWLTLRQWVALVLSNDENSAVRVLSRDRLAGGETLAIEVVRPGYGTAEFAFRPDGPDLLVVRSGLDGHLLGIDTPVRCNETNSLLLAVAKRR